MRIAINRCSCNFIYIYFQLVSSKWGLLLLIVVKLNTLIQARIVLSA